MRQHLHLSKLFFLIIADISKITMQRYELYFWHCRVLSVFVGFCQFLSVFSSTNICIIHKKSLTLQRLIILYKKVKMQTTSAQWLGCFCKKMCRSNTCKKSLRRKFASTKSLYVWVSEWIFCTKCNFLLPLRQHIFRQ